MSELAIALGLALVIEGVLYALFPAGMRRMMAAVLERPPELLRIAGLAGAAGGVLWIWLWKSLG
jgi:uncharacterized protein YjeT (DUF2065 family)